MTTKKSDSDRRPVHSNPSPHRKDRIAHAPYNFVPLPQNVVTTEVPPSQDRYTGLTGWFDCELETRSAFYIRGMMTLDQFDKTEKRKSTDLSVEEKLERAPFYSYRKPGGQVVPVIPGSSLRGMLRSLVEIVGYGKMKWINHAPSITFRAVAASREDPLAEPYRQIIGPSSQQVRAGYLEKMKDGKWQIWPALTPRENGWPDQGAFLKVRERSIPTGAIKDFYRFDDPDYLPEYYFVSFSTALSRNRFGQFTEVIQIGAEGTYEHRGALLVCSGNMIETSQTGQKSPRSKHALILGKNTRANPIELGADLINAYLNSLTAFQREDLWGRENGRPSGVLEDGAPVFYVTDPKSAKVLWFGHTPNFRVPALTPAGTVATPADLIPADLRGASEPDLAEAIFGWVEEKGGPKKQCAGRVFVTDANFVSAKDRIWYAEKPITPATLGSPKVTTFQHYLVQDSRKGHSPDNRKSLAHYIHSTEETEIRGHKLYWHKGKNPGIEADVDQRKKESQQTRISPVRPGVRFRFRVHFENLRPEELGALAWTLTLPAKDGRTYYHKIGMGKPLGMGSVAIDVKLYKSDRRQRYQSLFDNSRLNQAESADDVDPYIERFEQFVLQRIGVAPRNARLSETERIRMLLAMLRWYEGSPEWLDQTRYQIGNEYKERPVLPDPLAVARSFEVLVAKLPLPAEEEKTPLQGGKRDGEGKVQEQEGDASEYCTGTVDDFGLGIHGNTGIIRLDDTSETVLVHISGLAKGLDSLVKNDRVRFKVRDRKNGREAYDIKPAS